jgi:membrane associated rhomboid family serine protease
MAQKNTQSTENNVEFVFGKSNYRLLLISIAVVAAGFILMIGETDIYDFRKVTLAPIVVLSGFVIGFFAILKKPDQSK